jgi:hypothetical protein
VRAAIGPDGEMLAAQYADWSWRARLAVLLDDQGEGLADWERPIAFLRLANEVEERLDGADGYAPAHAAFVFPLDDVVRCARRIGREELIPVAEDVGRAVAGLEVPAALRTVTAVSGTVRPRSMRTRLWIRGAGDQSTVRRAARRVPGARAVVRSWRRWRPTARSD